MSQSKGDDKRPQADDAYARYDRTADGAEWPRSDGCEPAALAGASSVPSPRLVREQLSEGRFSDTVVKQWVKALRAFELRAFDGSFCVLVKARQVSHGRQLLLQYLYLDRYDLNWLKLWECLQRGNGGTRAWKEL